MTLLTNLLLQLFLYCLVTGQDFSKTADLNNNLNF